MSHQPPPIPPVPIADLATGNVTAEWWRWFNNVYLNAVAAEDFVDQAALAAPPDPIPDPGQTALFAELLRAPPPLTFAELGGSLPRTVDFVKPIVDSAGYPIGGGGSYIGSNTGPTERVWDAATWYDVAAGLQGTYLSSDVPIASEVALTTATAADVTSLALPEGDWDVEGIVAFDPDGTTTTSDQWAAVSQTSATLPTLGETEAMTRNGAAHPAGVGAILSTGVCRLYIAAPTTVYLVAQAVFAVSTNAAYGFIRARRVGWLSP